MPTIGKQSIPGSRYSILPDRPFDRVVSPILLLLLLLLLFPSPPLPVPLPRAFSWPGPTATVSSLPTPYILTVRTSCVPRETRSLGPLQRHTTTHVLLMLTYSLHRALAALTYCLLCARGAVSWWWAIDHLLTPPDLKFSHKYHQYRSICKINTIVAVFLHGICKLREQ